MDGLGELSIISETFTHPLPETESIRISKLNSALWISAIEMLEGRLILINSILKNSWWEQPENRSHFVSKSKPCLQLNDIRQVVLIIDNLLAKIASKETKINCPFNMKTILLSILQFKMGISNDPGFRMIFDCASQGVVSGDAQEFPKISLLPTEGAKARLWYKYYGFYAGVLKLIRFSGEALSKLKFNENWLEQEDGIILMLVSYAINSGRNPKTIENIYNKAKITANILPSSRLILTTVKAVHIRTKTQ